MKRRPYNSSRRVNRSSAPGAQRGIALMAVLGLVVFLSIIALSFSETQRLSSQITANSLASARAQAAADGAVHKMIFEVNKPRQADASGIEDTRWKANGIAYVWSENGVQVSVSARSEAAKIDLNFAAEALLKNLFVSAGVEDGEADNIVSAIRDWTDADNLKRPNGAEADEYRAAGKKVLPSNDFFVAVEELQNVMGVTPQLYLAVSPYLTVHSRAAGIDPLTASLDVLLKIPGLDPGAVSAWVETRDAAARDGQPVPPLTLSSPYFSGGIGTLRISAETATTDGITASRDAVVRIGAQQGVRPQFLLWKKASRAKSAPPAVPQLDSAEVRRG